MRLPVSAHSGAPIDLGQAWVFTDRDGAIVDATSRAAALLNVAFHLLVRQSLPAFLVDGRELWLYYLRSAGAYRSVSRLTRVRPASRDTQLVVLRLEVIAIEGRELCGWRLTELPPGVARARGAVGCPACGAHRLVVLDQLHGADCECEHCGHVWHCEDPARVFGS